MAKFYCPNVIIDSIGNNLYKAARLTSAFGTSEQHVGNFPQIDVKRDIANEDMKENIEQTMDESGAQSFAMQGMAQLNRGKVVN